MPTARWWPPRESYLSSLGDSARGGPSRRPSREQAAAKEGALERAVPVHPSSPEAGDLARGEETGQRRSVGPQDAPGQIGLQAAECLAGQDVEASCDQRPGGRIQQRVGLSEQDRPVAEVASRRSNREDLRVLTGPIDNTLVASGDFAVQLDRIEAWLVGQGVHSAHPVAEVARDDEVGAVFLEGFDPLRARPSNRSLQQEPDVLAR